MFACKFSSGDGTFEACRWRATTKQRAGYPLAHQHRHITQTNHSHSCLYTRMRSRTITRERRSSRLSPLISRAYLWTCLVSRVSCRCIGIDDRNCLLLHVSDRGLLTHKQPERVLACTSIFPVIYLRNTRLPVYIQRFVKGQVFSSGGLFSPDIYFAVQLCHFALNRYVTKRNVWIIQG